MNISDLIEPRPPWQAQAKCKGMGKAFNQATVAEQVAVCEGTTAPWDTPCPVMDECFDWFVDRTQEYGGMQQAYDNQLVHGGVDPFNMLRHCKYVRKLRA